MKWYFLALKTMLSGVFKNEIHAFDTILFKLKIFLQQLA